MTQVIYKYPLSLSPKTQSIYLPVRAKILHFGNQNETPTLWMEVELGQPVALRYFRMVGTGHEIPTDIMPVYIGTALFNLGAFVWHLYEVTS